MYADTIGKQDLWVPIEKTEVDVRIKSNLDSSLFIKRTQFPMMLSPCSHAHAQSIRFRALSLRKIVIQFQLLKQTNFSYGQIYVALSRFTSLEGLLIVDSFSEIN